METHQSMSAVVTPSSMIRSHAERITFDTWIYREIAATSEMPPAVRQTCIALIRQQIATAARMFEAADEIDGQASLPLVVSP